MLRHCVPNAIQTEDLNPSLEVTIVSEVFYRVRVECVSSVWCPCCVCVLCRAALHAVQLPVVLVFPSWRPHDRPSVLLMPGGNPQLVADINTALLHPMVTKLLLVQPRPLTFLNTCTGTLPTCCSRPACWQSWSSTITFKKRKLKKRPNMSSGDLMGVNNTCFRGLWKFRWADHSIWQITRPICGFREFKQLFSAHPRPQSWFNVWVYSTLPESKTMSSRTRGRDSRSLFIVGGFGWT